MSQNGTVRSHQVKMGSNGSVKKTLKVKKVQKRAKNCLKMHKSATICTNQESQCLPYVCPHPAFKQTDFCKERRKILTNIRPVDNFKSILEPYFPVEFPETCCGRQDYNILHSSHFPEIPGWPKWTFLAPQTFKPSSGEPKVIQLVT